jgi:hypothetical protein
MTDVLTPNTNTNTETSDVNKAMKDIIESRAKSFIEYNKSDLIQIKANISYICGHQNIEVRNGQIVELPEKYCTPVIANKILPAVRNDISVATKTNPKFDIIPAGTDEDDKATAKACEKILPYLQRINDPNLWRAAVVLWYDIDGKGWRKVYWNPTFRVTGKNPAVGEQGNNPALMPMSPIFEGDVVVEHIPNNELIYDRRITDSSKLKWIIHHKMITVAEATARYGKDFMNDISQSNIKEGNKGNGFESEIMGEFGRLAETVAPNKNNPNKEKLLRDDKELEYYEFWHVIDMTMPQGAYAEMVGGRIARNLPYPIETYPHGKLPFISAIPIPLYGIAPTSVSNISQARPLQRYFNEMLSLIQDNIDAMGNSVIITAKDANVDFKKMDNRSGNIITVDGPYVSGVRREPGTPIPGAYFAHLDNISRQIDEIFSFHEPSRGIMPKGGPKSAMGLQLLQDADSTQLSPLMKALDNSDQEVIYQMLSLAIANYGNKLLQIVGDDNAWTLAEIKQEELHGRINVVVRTGSSIPMNKALEMEKTYMAWTSGLLGNPQSPDIRIRVLKAMDLGGLDQILQSNAKDMNFAKKEFIEAEKLVAQIPPMPPEVTPDQQRQIFSQYIYIPPINSFDDDNIHSNEHRNHLLANYHKYLATQQPQYLILAQAMVDHLSLHTQRIMFQQQMMMQMANPQMFQQTDKKDAKTESAGKK